MFTKIEKFDLLEHVPRLPDITRIQVAEELSLRNLRKHRRLFRQQHFNKQNKLLDAEGPVIWFGHYVLQALLSDLEPTPTPHSSPHNPT
jgi:hypothetical protein